MRIAFRVDASERIGGGHVMRCLTLADALKAAGAKAGFVCASIPDALRRRVEAAGHMVTIIAADSAPDGDNWDVEPLADEAQQADSEATLAALPERPDWIVVDHYLLDRRWQQAVRGASDGLLVIDDLANRPHDCDLLLDQTLGRTAKDYRGFVRDEAQLLLGSSYALLRPEFARERPAALQRRSYRRPVERLFISLGTTDVGGVTANAVEAALAAAPGCTIDVVVSEAAPSFERCRQLALNQPVIAIHTDPPSIAQLMRDADLAIGAAGSTSWERCCLGLPSVTVVLADNQQEVARVLDDAGATLAAGVPTIEDAVATLVGDQPRLLAMAAAALAIIDGAGARRAADAILGTRENLACAIEIRPAEPGDSEALWLWRNDPATRAASHSTALVPWPDHARWLASVLADPGRHLWIAERAGEPVGMVRFDPLHGSADAVEVSFNIRPDARGGGTGRAILPAACQKLFAETPVRRIEATINEQNPASRRLFERCGFLYAGPSSADGFNRFVLRADDQGKFA